MRISPVRAELILADGETHMNEQTDIHDETNAFRNLANAPKRIPDANPLKPFRSLCRITNI
jgi:hypothetical protein